MNSIPFINRELELEKIDAAVRKWGTSHILCFNADGGIGKTRMFQEVYRRYASLESDMLAGSHGRRFRIALVKEYTVGQWSTKFSLGVKQMSKSLGVELIETVADFDLQKMVKDLASVITQKPDAIIINQGSDEILRSEIANAVHQGVKVLTFDNSLPQLDGVITSLTHDEYRGVDILLDKLAEDIGYRGKVAILWVEGRSHQHRRKRAFDNLVSKYPNIEVVAAIEPVHYDRSETIQPEIERLLAEHSDLKALWGTWDELGRYAVDTLIGMNRTDVGVYTFDLSTENIDTFIQPDSLWKAVVAADAVETGGIMIRLALQAIRGTPMKRQQFVPLSLLTQSQVRQATIEQVSFWPDSTIGWSPWVRSLAQDDTGEGTQIIKTTEIIDFDNALYHKPQNLARHIASLLDPVTFEPFEMALADLRKIERAEGSPERLRQEENDVVRVFQHSFNIFSSQSRPLLILDTTDAIQGDDIWSYIAKVFPDLTNYVLIIGGRNACDVGKFLAPHFDDSLEILDLKPFDDEVSNYYLAKKQELLYIDIPSDMARKLVFWSRGRPILLDLAVEWAAQGVSLDWLLNDKFSEFEALPPEVTTIRQKEFEFQLVHHIVDLREPIDRLALLMSRIYPITVDMLPELLTNLTEEQAQNLFTKAQTYVFVKTLPDGSIQLHDNMRYMINKYNLWDIADPDGERRERDSRIAVRYLSKTINAIQRQMRELISSDMQEWITIQQSNTLDERLEMLTLQLVFHSLETSIADGFEVWLAKIQDARRRKYRDRARQLEGLIEPYRDRLGADQFLEVQLLHCRLKIDFGFPEEALALLEILLHGYQINEVQEANVINAMGVAELRLGRLTEALHHQQRCAEIFSALGKDNFLPPVINQIGYIFRLLGQWGNAILQYQQALDIGIARTDTSILDIAGIMNNLGYVLGMDGRFFEGIDYCNQAIDLYASQNDGAALARGEVTLGAVLRNQGVYDKAERYLRSAILRYERLSVDEHLARAYEYLGTVYWFKGASTNNKGQLEIALDYLNQSYEIITKYDYTKDLPLNLLETGWVYWELGNQHKARELNSRALELASNIRDVYTLVYALVTRAEYDLEDSSFEGITEAFTELERHEDEGFIFSLLSGRMRRIVADMAFVTQDFDRAFEYYREGLILIARQGGYGKFSLQQELERLKEHLLQLPQKTALTWLTRFREYWSQQAPTEKYASMLTWCDQRTIQVRLRGAKSASY